MKEEREGEEQKQDQDQTHCTRIDIDHANGGHGGVFQDEARAFCGSETRA